MPRKQVSLKSKINMILLLIVLAVLLCWLVFFFRMLEQVSKTTQGLIAQVSDRVIDTMESTFLSLEHAAVMLSVDEDVNELLLETDPLLYHEKVGLISQRLNSIYQSNSLVEDVLIYDSKGVYCRLRGELGNTSVSRINILLVDQQSARHIIAILEREAYIGYVEKIVEGNVQLGYLVFLIKESHLQTLFMEYNSFDSLQIGLIVDGQVIASGNALQVGISADDFCEKSNVFSIRQIGLTPFQIIVADYGNTIEETFRSFLFSACITIVALLGLLILLYRFLNHLFLHPMFTVMKNVQQVGTPEGNNSLQPTGQAEFDQLVGQINSMVSRLDENSRTLFQMQYKMQNVEFEKQQAILISLKKQINAHFTVNTLNVVKRFNETGENEKAGAICDSLSELLRYANGAEDFISCRNELYTLEKYVDIMQIRYPGRFTVEFDAEEEMDDILLPRMLVQPIIENAILHGLLAAQKGYLYVSAKVEDGILHFTVHNNGKLIPADTLRKLQEKIELASRDPWGDKGIEHIALPNIQKRVVSMFGGGYGLTISSTEEKGTTVTLTLPVRKDTEDVM